MGWFSGSSSKTPTNEIQGANGPLRKGTRVQTMWDEGRGHDNQWYVGTVEEVFTNGHATISYDDPDTWTGEAVYIYALPPHHPGMTMKVTVGAPTMEGPPGMAPTPMAQPVFQPQQQMMIPQQHVMMPQQQMMMPPQAQPGMQVLTAQCPPNGGPGMTVTVQGPGGAMHVQVPPGCGPGQSFQFQVAAPQSQVAVAQAVPVQMGVPM